MNIQESENGILFNIRVNTASGKFRLYEKSGRLILDVKNRPEKSKVNMEIITELGKIFRKDVEILRGHRSRDKTILVRDISRQEIERILSS